MRETTAEEDKTFSSCPLSKEDIESIEVDLYKQVCIHKEIGTVYQCFIQDVFSWGRKLDFMYFSRCIVCFGFVVGQWFSKCDRI